MRITLLLVASLLLLQSAGCSDNFQTPEYLGIEKTEFQHASLSQAVVKFYLKYNNTNKFAIDVKETQLSIYLNDQFIAVADQPEITKIPSSSTFTFPVVARFDPLKILGPAMGSLFSKENKLHITGHAKCGKSGVFVKIPVDVTETVSLYKK